MQEQMQEQFEQLQQGLTTAFDNGSQLAAPWVQANEVLLDSCKQLFEAQFEFGQACVEIGRKQIAAVADSNDFSALADNQAAVDAWYAAITNYGDAVRKNAQDTHARMAPIGRDVTATVVGFGADVLPEQFTVAAKPVAAKPVAAKPVAADKQATDKAARKAPKKAAVRKAPTKASKKSPAKVAAKPAAKVADKAPASKVEVARPSSVPAEAQTKPAARTAPAKATPAAATKAAAKSASNNDDKVDNQAPAKSV